MAAIRLLFAALAALCLSAADPTTVILVRHAERSPGNGNVSISVAGQKRAGELARVLGDARVKAIYASTLRRTQQTAQPLAAKLGLTLVRIDKPAAIAVDIRAKHAGRTVVVVHHSNTLPDIAKELGVAAGLVSVAGNEFDAMFLVTDTGSGSSVMKLRYGARSFP